MSEILDSGARTEYASGAVRDVKEDRGRMDLLPLDIIKELITYKTAYPDQHTLSEDYMFTKFNSFIRKGNTDDLYEVLQTFINREYNGDFEKAIMELSIHYEQGARKYAERNWEKGIPTHSFADSALRHGVKYFRGDDDEPHNRAFMWNIVGLLWTMKHKPKLNDLPFAFTTINNEIDDDTEVKESNEPQDIGIEPDHTLENTISDRIESEAIEQEKAMFVFKIFYDEIDKENPERISKMVGQMADKEYSENYKLYILEKDAVVPIAMDIPSDSIGFYNNEGFAEIHVLLDFQDKNMAKVIDLINDSEALKIFITCKVAAEIAGVKDFVGYEFPIGEHYFTMTYPLEASPKYKAPEEENSSISLAPVESDDEVSNNDGSISFEALGSTEDSDGGEEVLENNDSIINPDSVGYLQLTFMIAHRAAYINNLLKTNYRDLYRIEVNGIKEPDAISVFYESEFNIDLANNSINIRKDKLSDKTKELLRNHFNNIHMVYPEDSVFKSYKFISE